MPAVTGEQSNTAQGDAAKQTLIQLRSRKSVSGSASFPLSGMAATVQQALLPSARSRALIGSSAPSSSGTLTASGGTGDADWIARSTASGVVVASRLDTQAIINAWKVNDSTVVNISLDTTIKVAGTVGSLKFAVLNSDSTASGSVSVPLGRTFGVGDVIWFSFRRRAPESYLYQPWPRDDGGYGAAKLAIFSRDANGALPQGSNQVNEIVLQMKDELYGGYNQDGNVTAVDWGDVSFASACSGSDFRRQNQIDNNLDDPENFYPLTGVNPDTGAGWTACEQDRRRRGGLYSAGSLATFKQGLADPLTGGMKPSPSSFDTVTIRAEINSLGGGANNNRISMWVARNGQPYRLLIDKLITLGAGPLYNGLTLLPYTSNRLAGGRKITSRTNNITGVQIESCGLSTAIGDGVLEYDGSTQRFRWHGAGEAFGTARGFDANNKLYVIPVISNSPSDSYVILTITPESLPGVTVPITDTVTIANGRPDTQTNYNDLIVSTLPIKAVGGFSPSGVNALSDLAAAMAPGTWAQLGGIQSQDSVLGVGPTTGSMLPYMNAMPWNPIFKVIEIVGMDHNNGAQRHAQYNIANNRFDLIQADDGNGVEVQHGYDHSEVNPVNGDLYHKMYTLNSFSIHTKKKVFGGNFASIPDVSSPGGEQVALGTCWWTGAFTAAAGHGAQGAFMVYNGGGSTTSATDGQIVAYNPLTNTWFYNQYSRSPNNGPADQYHSVMAYSPVYNVAVYGGGNSAPRGLWKMASNGAVTTLTLVPAGKQVGVTQGILLTDPATGKFLLLSAGQLWELDPTGTGTWTQQIGGRAPPAGAGIPGTDNMFGCAIPELGVVVFVKQTVSVGGTFYVYKHA